MTPFVVSLKKGEKVPVPCGRCPSCFSRRVSQWSFRLMQEEKVSTSAHFITLTYDTAHVPITQKGFMSVDKNDVQLFFKRLRKLNSDGIKYFLAAEYGGRTERPHYHIILFNCDIKTIQRAWDLGSVHYGNGAGVTGATIGYTLKYMSKVSKIPKHENDDRAKPFGLMSKGLGSSYLTEAMCSWHHQDKNNRMYCNLQDGKKIGMPRYYKEKIYTEDERKIIGWHTRKRQLEKQEAAREAGGEAYEENRAKAINSAFAAMAVKANSISNNKI